MMTAIEYTREVGLALVSSIGRFGQDSPYYGQDGCLRLAREYGYGLRGYAEKEAVDALRSSYGMICVIGYNLKPPVDAKEWVAEVEKARTGKVVSA